jgi:hypothetical protein
MKIDWMLVKIQLKSSTPRGTPLGSIYLLLNENFLFTGDLFGIAEGDLHGWLSFDTPA